MKLQIIKKLKLDGIPSASGIDIFDNKLYIIGDDSPYLYTLDEEYKLIEKTEIFKTEHFSTGRIPKKLKEDLECSTIINYENNNYLLISGSGSQDNRNNAYLIDLTTKETKKFQMKLIYSLFLDIYKDVTSINVEAICADNKFIYFFNRGGKNELNIVLRMTLDHLFEYFNTKNISDFTYILYTCELPSINDISSGFSGATIYDNKMFFTSSVENTDNSIDDGEILGSLISLVDYSNNNFEIIESCYLLHNNRHLVVKIESISILSKEDNKYRALLVTDDDFGGSELIEVIIEI